MKDKKGIVRGKEEVDRIRVFVRVRPQNEEELRRGEPLGFETIHDRNEITLNDGKERKFHFDGIFPGSSTNKQVYYQIGKPLIDAAFRGFNGTLMAYGQTGTGKTYTQMSHTGVCVLAVQKLFRRIRNDVFHDYKVYMSYLQIYQEKIFDLLNPNHKLEMVLREDPKKGVYVENLTEYVVRSAEEVMSLIRSGKKRLIFAETRMNRLSSRSHSVCQITIERAMSRDGQRSASISSTSSTSQSLKNNTPNPSPPRTNSNPAIGVSKIPMPKSSTPRAHIGEHAAEGSRIPTLRRGSTETQRPLRAFFPHQASTPNLPTLDGIRIPVSCSHSSSMTSLPESPSPFRGPNRLSFQELNRSYSGSMDSDAVSVDSDMMGSEEDSAESLRSPSATSGNLDDFFEIFDDEEDDEEAFLQSIKICDDIVTKGKVNICDLAGSERVKRAQVDGERLSELQHINLSLLELGNTIHALSEGNRSHIPFRNSSLTRLLQDSLGGNCKTIFVMCVSPSRIDMNETRCTLEFGQRALQIKNTTYANLEVDFVKLAADLRRKLEARELEILSQKETFEKQVCALQTDQMAKLAEKESLLENEKEEAMEEAQKLRIENVNLQKLLQEKSAIKDLLEKEQVAILEKSVRDERRISMKLGEREKEIEELQRALKEEKRRSIALEERERTKLESLLEEERKYAANVQLLERQKFESELEEERNRVEEQRKQTERDFRDACCQSPVEEVIHTLPENDRTSTETFYNVLLAEIMSLQLLYQMQDIADVCCGVVPRAADSGWADYDDELLENVGMNLLEKGGLILNTLRGVQSGDIASFTSNDSLRDVFLFQFPSSPKLSCNTDRSNPSILETSRDLLNDFERKGSNPLCNASCSTIGSKISSDFSTDGNRNLQSGASSSMGSYCDQEPLSPRAVRHSDSGCSTQHSETDISPIEQKLNQQKELGKKIRGSNVCVPLAEEDDEELFEESVMQMSILKDKVSNLDMELLRLKDELDRETVNFFSAVFLIDLSSYTDEDFTRVMRYIFECVRDKLCTEIAAQGDNKETCSKDLELPLSVLEQAVNLLLVNKTVMSCILVLQNRARASEESQEEDEGSANMSSTLVPQEVIKVDQGIQTDEHSKSFRRHIRKGLLNFTPKYRNSVEDTGTCTDPEPKSPVHHRECQTSDDWTLSSDGQPNEITEQEDPFSKQFEEQVTSYSEDLSRDMLSRDSALAPDGASVVDEETENADSLENKKPSEKQLIESDDDEEEQSKQKKKRLNFLSCLGPRVSFRKKGNSKKSGQKTDKSRSDKNK